MQQELEKRFGIPNYDVKFDIVRHSMGGWLARYYLRYGDAPLPEDGSLPPLTWAGARHVERAILISAPNGGSLHALRELVRGRDFGPFLPTYPSALLGTMPAIYQLLPRTRHQSVLEKSHPTQPVDIFEPAVWEQLRWGLAAPDQDACCKSCCPRRRIAPSAVVSRWIICANAWRAPGSSTRRWMCPPSRRPPRIASHCRRRAGYRGAGLG